MLLVYCVHWSPIDPLTVMFSMCSSRWIRVCSVAISNINSVKNISRCRMCFCCEIRDLRTVALCVCCFYYREWISSQATLSSSPKMRRNPSGSWMHCWAEYFQVELFFLFLPHLMKKSLHTSISAFSDWLEIFSDWMGDWLYWQLPEGTKADIPKL